MSSRTPSSLAALAAALLLAPATLASGGSPDLAPGTDLEAALLSAAPAVSPAGKVFMNRDEALKLAFPKCEVERSTAYLDPAHVKRVAELSKLEYDSAVAYTYRATKEGKWVGTAYFDTHRVRTMRETVMVVVEPDAGVGRIEVLSFGEPVEYIPRDRWYAQFKGQELDGDLFLGRDIRGVTGATLTAVATTNCSRRVLALHQVLGEIAEAERKEAARKKREAEEKRKREAEKGDDKRNGDDEEGDGKNGEESMLAEGPPRDGGTGRGGTSSGASPGARPRLAAPVPRSGAALPHRANPARALR